MAMIRFHCSDSEDTNLSSSHLKDFRKKTDLKSRYLLPPCPPEGGCHLVFNLKFVNGNGVTRINDIDQVINKYL
jgi:hypothetical protein